MKSELRTIVDSVVEKHLGAGRLKHALVYNDNHKTLRRIKYCFIEATDSQRFNIWFDLRGLLPKDTFFAIYNTKDDSRSYSSRYNGLAVTIWK